ncbi:LysR family transcriptional regulator [Mesorhizobium sp. ANAO-SY3R2]|uniref:LysR family transcriptional regulator n=1 Tax=Mesorhizobium sp. ANAO-SY3R2 TaxID=3166644 RepID=UPI003671AFC3
MELRHLRYFVAVAATENFSQAALKLNVVQSAVSRQVRELELQLGCDLFDRIGKRVRLSAFGVQFLAQAQRILADVEQARSHAVMVAKGQLGILRVALQVAAFDRPTVLRSIKLFKSENPDVELVLLPMGGEQVVEAVRSGSVDGGFVYAPMTYPELAFERLSPEEWLLAMPRGHRLATMPEICLRDLTGEPFIWLPRHVSPILHDRMLAACHNGGLVPNIVQTASDRLLLLGLIEVGIGLCFLPGPIGGERSKEIVLRHVSDFSLPAYPSFIWKQAAHSPTRQRLLETIRRIKQEDAAASA